MTKQHDFQEDMDAIGRSKTVLTLLETVALATGMGFVTVAHVTATRWVTCRAIDQIDFGLGPGDELDVTTTLCNEVRQYDREIIIEDVETDLYFRNHPCATLYGFRSYISVPIHRADGSFFGTLCAFDPKPASLSEDRVLSMFRLFARMIGELLDSQEELSQSQDDLVHERTLAGVQEKFIAILAHDLRNPVNALTAGLRLIERGELDQRNKDLVELMRASVNRMGLLIENLLDQARKRSGAGIVVERDWISDLGVSLQQIMAELQAVAPKQPINSEIDLPAPIHCDAARISQLFSNLLANAVTHGTHGAPVQVRAQSTEEVFHLSVTNKGEKIGEDRLPSLFEPFERGGDRPSREGLGLGLYIASEIAKAHGGTLSVTSTEEETAFTFEMPNQPGAQVAEG